MQEEPSGVQAGEGFDLEPRMEGRQQAEQERQRQKEDAEGERPVTPVDEREGQASSSARKDCVSWVSTGSEWCAALSISVSETKWKSSAAMVAGIARWRQRGRS